MINRDVEMRTKYAIHPSWRGPHTGDDYTPAKTLMRGLSTYFKGSFQFGEPFYVSN